MTPAETRAARARRNLVKRAARIEEKLAAWERAGEPEPEKDEPDGRYCPTTTQIEAEAARIKAEAFAGLSRRMRACNVPLEPYTPRIYKTPKGATG